MSDGVRSNLMTISVQVLHLGIVCPLVGHIEGRFDWAAVRVETSSKEVLIEGLVEIIDSIIEGEHDKLGDLVGRVSARDILSTTVAVRDLAECRVAVTCFKLSFGPVVSSRTSGQASRGQQKHGPHRDKCPQTHQ